MAAVNEDNDFATFLGSAFIDIFAPVVGPDASRHDFYSAVADALGQPVSPDRFKQLLPDELVRLRHGMQRSFEVTAISEQHVLAAIQRTLQVGGY